MREKLMETAKYEAIKKSRRVLVIRNKETGTTATMELKKEVTMYDARMGLKFFGDLQDEVSELSINQVELK